MKSHKITVRLRDQNRIISKEIPEGESILRKFEEDGEVLPFSCRNGCCTTCAVRILSGTIDQHDGIGLSKQMQENGYGLLCIAKVTGPADLETQDEDEVYELQFGRYLGSIKNRTGNPFDM
ncbi:MULTISPECIES: 2Fe-2S iron-sulfur cluster-binding protein [Prochlorococcus]|uniref:Ferredoxin, PetF n=1 Tax=Prochlorococcus marinus (strain SARG / CCMP1375 / SS120) TaxID=167539 RepID=Q7VBU9_PROMA|nr:MULTISPECIES: 2Fe-2S iron-sulfur cluster-binding protein [Prochlorococcus]AAQ00038.1 Ferredoxin, PetF [Prochlorococcus marinus subsp. marinus str. CCMP1375]KGG13835.1 soluble (2Fe-2S) ferredoxin [Prochlorococcus marinus str. LG]KGG18969.1 soluble (2Fe-2S) ferredoxin [Prochlorococcus marinus str. SS2]KGG23492.1 soluble (2Fe-2S) ferredoxin [Prochlorococcus marinus str. SS35]KGG32272.1 soluble (2Fe-2S) ferredoxin [Prochlorococcus marinus str. SS51]